jgi:hypothetical protein
MKIELDINESKLKADAQAALDKAVSQAISSQINHWQFQDKIKATVQKHLQSELDDVTSRLVAETKELEARVLNTMVNKLTNKVIKELTQ